MPPDHIWEDDKGLKDHWALVRQRSEEKYGSKKDMETVPMEQNDLARELKG